MCSALCSELPISRLNSTGTLKGVLTGVGGWRSCLCRLECVKEPLRVKLYACGPAAWPMMEEGLWPTCPSIGKESGSHIFSSSAVHTLLALPPRIDWLRLPLVRRQATRG